MLTAEERDLLLDKVVIPPHLKEIILNIPENSEIIFLKMIPLI